MKFTSSSWTCLFVLSGWTSLTEASYNGYSSSYTSSSSSSSSSYTYNSDAYGTNFFADSETAYYDGYQQAWRYLGWYVKCGAPSDRYDNQDEHGSHSADEEQDNEQTTANHWCQRYLIWAAVRVLGYFFRTIQQIRFVSQFHSVPCPFAPSSSSSS